MRTLACVVFVVCLGFSGIATAMSAGGGGGAAGGGGRTGGGGGGYRQRGSSLARGHATGRCLVALACASPTTLSSIRSN